MKNISFSFLIMSLAFLLTSCEQNASNSTTNHTGQSTVIAQSVAHQEHQHNHRFEQPNDYRACSYDGSPVTINPGSFQTTRASTQMIDKIMSYVGLPQNFVIMKTDEVPNAAAVIMLNKQKVPEHIIAFNPKFMEFVMSETANNNWAPVSIMAHEIGHHLCGHTITPGGSQPPIELEADKFSGFVLQKMGASIENAVDAISKLTNESDGGTHPPRSRRLSAIKEGWNQACKQNKWGDCNNPNASQTPPNPSTGSGVDQPIAQAETPATTTPSNGSSVPKTTPIRSTTGSSSSSTTPINKNNENQSHPLPRSNSRSANTKTETTRRAQNVSLPILRESSIPTKFDRFIYDEANVLTDDVRASLNASLQQFAETDKLEVVTIITNDLQGKNIKDYAYAMLHQLRVGQMDIGNGACLVMHPAQKDYYVALMPGLRFKVKESDLGLLENKMDFFYQYIDFAKNKVGDVEKKREIAGDALLRSCKTIRDAATGNFMDWVIRYQNVADMQAAYEKILEQGASANRDIRNNPVARKLINFSGKVT